MEVQSLSLFPVLVRSTLHFRSQGCLKIWLPNRSVKQENLETMEIGRGNPKDHTDCPDRDYAYWQLLARAEKEVS